MFNIPTIVSLIEVVLVLVPALLAVAYVTVAERKTMASMQRRLGPNVVGYYGLLQAFADALKLLLKEYVAPTQANMILFFLGPVITLIFALLGYAVIPYGPALSINDMNLGIFYMLAVSSIATYGILLAGWSANSKYAFLGSLRSTAQLISYELVLSSAILIVVMLTGSLNLSVVSEGQRAVWFVLPLLPIFIIFFIGSIAETNRAPFDLAEAESELVSGFMTEHAAVVFVFFFLAEYGSIVLMCILTSLLFLGGYLPMYSIMYIPALLPDFIHYVFVGWEYSHVHECYEMFKFEVVTNDERFGHIWDIIFRSTDVIVCYFILNPIAYFILSLPAGPAELLISSILTDPDLEGLVYGITIGLKSSIMIFVFIWARASFPRIRFDQLMSFCWTVLLPILFASIIFVPCVLFSFDIFPVSLILI